MDADEREVLTNRQKAQEPKPGRHWCDRCDRALVGQIGKCPECGVVQDGCEGKVKR